MTEYAYTWHFVIALPRRKSTATPIMTAYDFNDTDCQVSRGPSYGIPSVRVDGMDLLAVHRAVSEARAKAAQENTPVLVEAMCYRGGHHSTSDDSSRYRKKQEIQFWLNDMNPLVRTRQLLEKEGKLTSSLVSTALVNFWACWSVLPSLCTWSRGISILAHDRQLVLFSICVNEA